MQFNQFESSLIGYPDLTVLTALNGLDNVLGTDHTGLTGCCTQAIGKGLSVAEEGSQFAVHKTLGGTTANGHDSNPVLRVVQRVLEEITRLN